ncbi:hypothetical protein D3C80_1774330 [compost metagenome]
MALRRSSLASLDEVAITVAPASLANCRAKIDTPPVPCTSTLSPGLRAPSAISARQAVRPAVVRVAASAWLQPCGARVNEVARAVTTSRA